MKDNIKLANKFSTSQKRGRPIDPKDKNFKKRRHGKITTGAMRTMTITTRLITRRTGITVKRRNS